MHVRLSQSISIHSNRCGIGGFSIPVAFKNGKIPTNDFIVPESTTKLKITWLFMLLSLRVLNSVMSDFLYDLIEIPLDECCTNCKRIKNVKKSDNIFMKLVNNIQNIYSQKRFGRKTYISRYINDFLSFSFSYLFRF